MNRYSLKKVFSDWRYVLFSIAIAVIFYSLNVFIASWKTLFSFYSSNSFLQTVKLFFILFLGFYKTILISSFVSLTIISVLLGILFSLLVYKSMSLKIQGNYQTGIFGTLGIFLGLFIPGCAACGVGLAAALGLSAGIISFFPYDGLELSILAIGILIIVIIRTTKTLNTCTYVYKSSERRKQ